MFLVGLLSGKQDTPSCVHNVILVSRVAECLKMSLYTGGAITKIRKRGALNYGSQLCL